MLQDETKKTLRKHGINLSKKQGQSHVVDEDLLDRIIGYADISSDEHVLEIGPGTGNLTARLVREAGGVTAVEKDERLVEVLRERLGGEKNLRIIIGDVLEEKVPVFDKVVANLPYSISSPLTFKLLDRKFDSGVLMYQKEFSERMVADPGSSEYSRLSVNLARRAEVEILEEVPPNAFYPRPDVWSAVVRLKPREPTFEVRDEKIFSRTVKASFQHRRKKIRNSLLSSFDRIFPDNDFSKDLKKAIVKKAIPSELSDSRPGKICPEDFGRISDSLEDQFSKES